MIRKKYLLRISVTLGIVMMGISCSDSFLDQPPKGTYSDVSLINLKGVEGLLISTYAALDGSYFESWDNNYFNQNSGASNWIWGSIRSGDSYKGTEPSDGVDINPVERHEAQPSNPYLMNKWLGTYDGIAHANQTLRTLALAVAEGLVDPAVATRIEGEARFLRAHFHFEVVKVFRWAAFVPETAITPEELRAIPNDHLIYPEIEADFRFAYENLPETQVSVGRANKWAAGAYLAKVMMFQSNFTDALPILKDVIQNGQTTGGTPYALNDDYADNFRIAAEENNSESIFAYEASAVDGSIANGNYENTLNVPHGSSAATGCCGFFQPSQNLVNSFKTFNGLPMDDFNDVDVASDEGIPSTANWVAGTKYKKDEYVTRIDGAEPNRERVYKSIPADAGDGTGTNVGNDPLTSPAQWTLAWVESNQEFDPRIDWTIGRRGVPYLDWGLHPGKNWVRLTSNGGPYSPMKNVPYLSDYADGTAKNVDWGFVSTAANVQIIRYADVLLWAAECEAEVGVLTNALDLVNQIRDRAANSSRVTNPDNSEAANYSIDTYAAFASKAEALEAIRWERKLEFAMEGMRFFDLVRWDESTTTALPFDIVTYMNDYLDGEANRNHLAGATFTAKYKYEPLPEYVITQGVTNGVRMIDNSTEWGGSRGE